MVETPPTPRCGEAELWFQPVATVCAAATSAALWPHQHLKKCLIVLGAEASTAPDLTLSCAAERTQAILGETFQRQKPEWPRCVWK